MKNIHLILVNKAVASLYHCSNTRDFFTTRQTSDDLLYEVYITSDEEIKEKDSFYDLTTKKVFYACKDMLTWRHDTKEKHKNWEKIILTTDQDLIKDGVQAIDDEFLEWFVKNPSCEEVEVKPLLSNNGRALFGYKIIIPQEEPNPFELPKTLPDDVFYESLEPKQETLEEAAEDYTIDFATMSAFKLGAKWQQERMYSEEYVIALLESLVEHPTKPGYKRIDILKVIEQFKK